MSDLPLDDPDRLNMAELVSRIERQQAETRKFAAEQAKLSAEQSKLAAEAAKYSRERFLAPFALAVASIGGGAALFAAAQAFLRARGQG